MDHREQEEEAKRGERGTGKKSGGDCMRRQVTVSWFPKYNKRQQIKDSRSRPQQNGEQPERHAVLSSVDFNRLKLELSGKEEF